MGRQYTRSPGKYHHQQYQIPVVNSKCQQQITQCHMYQYQISTDGVNHSTMSIQYHFNKQITKGQQQIPLPPSVISQVTGISSRHWGRGTNTAMCHRQHQQHQGVTHNITGQVRSPLILGSPRSTSLTREYWIVQHTNVQIPTNTYHRNVIIE